jgi:DNA polymerase-3 subunit epsilon
LRRWLQSLRARFAGAGPSLAGARWVVLDCETSGLDPARDRLLALGAVAVRGGRIELGESFDALLRQDRPSEAANILVHGIGGDAQRGGRAPAEALGEFSAFLGRDLPVAFHADFDAAVLAGAGFAAQQGWLDLARLAPALFPRRGSGRALDDWLEEFGIASPQRHDALGDALATAELFLVLLAEAQRQGIASVRGVRRAAESARWLA